MFRRYLISCSLLCLWLGLAAAQELPSPLATARQLASAGHRREALVTLEQYLSSSPQDGDARLYYGIVLSWESHYEDARRELRQVLSEHPDDADALLALSRVEIWSGHRDAARALLNKLLQRQPADREALSLSNSVNQSGSGSNEAYKWQVYADQSHDWFSGGLKPWNEYTLSLKAPTRFGSVILHSSEAQRFTLHSEQTDIEFYPHLRKGLYAYVDGGFSNNGALYPRARLGFELFQSLGHGYEISAGFRRLLFADPVTVYTASLTKYYHRWQFVGRTYLTPGVAGSSASLQVVGKRYFGHFNDFWAVRFSQGSSPSEVRTIENVQILQSTTLGGDLNKTLGSRWTTGLHASFGREDRLFSGTVSHTSTDAYLAWAF